jgi:hypothetical protein
MVQPKKKSQSHIIDQRAQTIFQSYLPNFWTIREYKPDYGIDFAIELFEERLGTTDYITLGEHLFVQLKGSTTISPEPHRVSSRGNVEKEPKPINNTEIESYEIEVIPFTIDVSLLLTVQRMGASVPLLLVITDVNTEDVYFVCLNDYVDKVLIPEDPRYYEKKTKKLYIPISNKLSREPSSLAPLAFYAKRAKLYAAFQKIAYQAHELEYVNNAVLLPRARHFAEILVRYDFWKSCDYWPAIKSVYQALDNFVTTGDPQLMASVDGFDPHSVNGLWLDPIHGDGEVLPFAELHQLQQIRLLWQRLSSLGSMYEELCREWHLPTYMGIIASG